MTLILYKIYFVEEPYKNYKLVPVVFRNNHFYVCYMKSKEVAQMLYFSYGSNMNQENMDNFCKKVNRPFIDMRDRYYQKGILKGYKIDFNFNDARLGGGVLNVMPSDEDDYVEGVVFEMSDEEMKTCDMKEAAPREYCRTPLPITLDDGRVLNDVIVYIACKEYLVEFTSPSETYKRDIIEGAKAFGLSKEWIEKLEKLPTQEN